MATRYIKSIFIKQTLSYFKNPGFIATPVMFLTMTALFQWLLVGEDDTANFANVFSIIFVAMSMVGTATALIMEDKMTSNLRFMSMAGVKPWQYLLGTGLSLALSSFIVLILFALIGGFRGEDLAMFFAITMAGAVTSILLGITLGLLKLPLLSMPISMVLAFINIIADANETVDMLSTFIYTRQIHLVLNRETLADVEYPDLPVYIDVNHAIMIILINLVVVIIFFLISNLKNTLEK